MPVPSQSQGKAAGLVPGAPAGERPAMSAPASGLYQVPKVDAFRIRAKLTGSFKEIAEALGSVSFLEVALEKDAVNAAYVESKDINKNPYLFSITKFRKDELEVVYSIPSEIAPRKRKLDVIHYLLNILSLVESSYQVENGVLYQLVETAVKDLLESVTMDYSKLYTAFDSMKKDVDDLRKKVERLQEQNEALSGKNYELKALNDDLAIRIQQFQGLSDDALKAKLQEWVLEHSGEINVMDFTKVHNIPESRVEQMLNKLVAEGYLELIK